MCQNFLCNLRGSERSENLCLSDRNILKDTEHMNMEIISPGCNMIHFRIIVNTVINIWVLKIKIFLGWFSEICVKFR
jgi:hypothetical protein